MHPYLTLHHPSRANEYYSKGFWKTETLYQLLLRHAMERPQTLAARDGNRTLTWEELRHWVDGVSAALIEKGVSVGERVSIWSNNRLESIVFFLACSRSGFACNPSLHRTYTSDEIVHLIDRLQSRVLLTCAGWGADSAANQTEKILEKADSLSAIWTPESFPGPAEATCDPVNDPDSVVYLAFTSGTTGEPKCVMHSDNTLLANARDLVQDWKHAPETRLLTLSPLSHHIAWVAVAQWLVAGCTIIADDPPPNMTRFDWIVETGATYVMGVPTHAMDILAEQEKRGGKRLGKVELFYMAGAIIPPTVAEKFVKQGIKPQNVYGMTECSSHQYTHPDDDTAIIINSCGRGGKAYEVRLFHPDNADKEVSQGTIGQIGGRGAALMLGYFGSQNATEYSFNRDGWFMSGDLGVMDRAGNLRIEGRLKDLIIRGGHNIYPARIETLALRHPKVTSCAAYPVADERLGERVCLAVIGDVDSDNLSQHLADEGLSKYDMPEYYLKVEKFPLTASGKIVKRELVEMTRKGILKPTPAFPKRSVDLAHDEAALKRDGKAVRGCQDDVAIAGVQG